MHSGGFARIVLAVTVASTLGACANRPAVRTASIIKVSHTSADRECMARAMYFESHRSADEGMLAVGTVVANRLDSGRYGASVCEIVGQKRQFAPGVMTRSMDGEAAERARRAADAVLSGKRHPGVRNAMFFHTAGLRFRYPNMHYVLVAGGNAFYEKREVASARDARDNARTLALALAKAKVDPTGPAQPIVVASSDALPPYAVPAIAPAASAPAPARVRTTVPATTPALESVVAPKPVGLAYAAAEPPVATPVPARAPQRVLSPATLTAALASAGPVSKPLAPARATGEPLAASQTVGWSPVPSAFSAFETR